MSAYDPVMAASDPRVVAVVLARDVIADLPWARPFVLSEALRERGFTATEERARALLDAVAAWDNHDPSCREDCGALSRIDAALDAICGSES